jgi:hypothetical protein
LGYGEDADGVKKISTRSISWSTGSCTSWSGEWWRLKIEGGSVLLLGVANLRDRENRGCQPTRQGEGRRLRPVRGCGVAWSHRISEFLPAAMANSGEESGQPGGAVGSGTGGEMVRGSRASYSRGDASIMAGSKRNWRGRDFRARRFPVRSNRWRRWYWRVGPGRQRKNKIKKR